MLTGLALVFALFAAEPPALPASAVAVVEDAYRVWRAAAERVWTGWGEKPPPLVYITAGHEYAIGFPGSLPGFTPQPDVRVAGFPVQVRPTKLPPGLAASFPFEGIPAAILGSPEALEKGPEAWAITATHEMFHVYQASRGGYGKTASLEIGPKDDGSWQLTFPFPYQDRTVMSLVHLQGYLLWLVASVPDAEQAKYNLGTALEAVGAYEAYLNRLPDGARAYRYSKFQEWNEGVAAYTEYRVAEEVAKLDGFERYRKLWDEVYRDRALLAKHAGRVARSRTAFYHLGTAKALALDRTNPHWKDRYFNPNVWLDDLLRETPVD